MFELKNGEMYYTPIGIMMPREWVNWGKYRVEDGKITELK